MPEQITFYHDELKLSPFCHRVAVALIESGAPYTAHGFDIFNKPAWFTTQINPLTKQIPVITYGGPSVPPEEPSPQSFKLAESSVILEFLADLCPNSTLLPPRSNPTARARARYFADTASRSLDEVTNEMARGNSSMNEKILEGLEKVQDLLPDPDVAGGEYAIGKDFTIADCVMVPILGVLEVWGRSDVGNFAPGTGKKLAEAIAGPKFERLRRYQKALWERESVKTVADLDRHERSWMSLVNPK